MDVLGEPVFLSGNMVFLNVFACCEAQGSVLLKPMDRKAERSRPMARA